MGVGLVWQAELSGSVQQLLVALSSGCFLRHFFAHVLLLALHKNLPILPIVVEVGFQFPTQEFYQVLAEQAVPILRVINGHWRTADELVRAVHRCFTVAAITMQPSEGATTQAIIEMRCSETARRLLELQDCWPQQRATIKSENASMAIAVSEPAEVSDEVKPAPEVTAPPVSV